MAMAGATAAIPTAPAGSTLGTPDVTNTTMATANDAPGGPPIDQWSAPAAPAWIRPLLACDDCCFTTEALICPCIAFGENMKRVKAVHSMICPTLAQCCCLSAAGAASSAMASASGAVLWVWTGVACVLHLLPCVERTSFRYAVAKKRGLSENVCLSGLAELFCYPCSLAQIKHEVVTNYALFLSGRHSPTSCCHAIGCVTTLDDDGDPSQAVPLNGWGQTPYGNGGYGGGYYGPPQAAYAGQGGGYGPRGGYGGPYPGYY